MKHLEAASSTHEKREELELDFRILPRQMWSLIIYIGLGIIWGYRRSASQIAFFTNDQK